MSKYDVTIGVPVYNSVNFVRRALDSALEQSYSSIEYLVVDDAGYDGSIDVVRSIKETHPRGNHIHIISHKENLGVAASRNDIIDKAQGEYLYFMDSDDIIAENTIELMMQNVRHYNAEIVFGSYKKIETSGKEIIYQYPSLQLLKEGELASFAYRKYGGIQASACNYLVKTEMLRTCSHRFVDVSYWEDLVFTFDLVTFVSRAVLLPDITYTYICRDNSLSHYQERINIFKAEVMNNVEAINHLKDTSVLLYNKDYYPDRCYNIVMTDFYIACTILRRRKTIIPYITDDEIKTIMKHPASFSEMCSFHHAKIKNLLFYFLGILPPFLGVFFIRCIGKVRKMI